MDTQADIIIADHARKGNPPGSISWKYIEDSVKNGRLEDLDNYYAGPAPGAIRPVGAGASHPAKLGRTPFTAEDDRILVDWVTKAERSGSATKGNAIYQQLAEKASHPSYLSQGVLRSQYVVCSIPITRISHGETVTSSASLTFLILRLQQKTHPIALHLRDKFRNAVNLSPDKQQQYNLRH